MATVVVWGQAGVSQVGWATEASRNFGQDGAAQSIGRVVVGQNGVASVGSS